MTFKNSLIVGAREGASCIGTKWSNTVGMETPWKRGSFTVENCTFVNFNEEYCPAIDPCYKAYKNDCANTGKFYHTNFYNSSNKVKFTYETEYIIEDFDGSFIGKAGKILPYSGILPMDVCQNNSRIGSGSIDTIWCPEDLVIRKFGLSGTPESFYGSDMIISNSAGELIVPWRQLRHSHAKGNDFQKNIANWKALIILNYLVILG